MDVVRAVLEPPERGGGSECRDFVTVVASLDDRDCGVAPVGELHQSTFKADHGEAVDDADCPSDVPGLDLPPVGLAEVGQLVFDEVGPMAEARPDTAGADRAGKFREP